MIFSCLVNEETGLGSGDGDELLFGDLYVEIEEVALEALRAPGGILSRSA
jgi:hypothetical protein